MNPIQPKKQSPDVEGINPVLIYENGANDSEKYQIPRKSEHKYMNSELRHHFYANCLRSDYEGTT